MEKIISSQAAARRPINGETTAVPADMRIRDQWLPHKNKVPIDPGTGKNADYTNPDILVSYNEAATYATVYDLDGVEFILRENDPFFLVDQDKCRDPETGEIDESALEVVAGLDTYTEVSCSGTGLHSIGKGSIPGNHKRSDNIEIYDRDRPVVFTGNHLPGTPITVSDRQFALEGLYYRVFGHSNATSEDADLPPATGLSDEQVLGKLLSAKNRDKFMRLWAGDISDYGSDDSSADMAMASLIGFYTGGNTAQVARIMRRSGLNRKKFDRPDYLPRTIIAALGGKTEDDIYTPKPDEVSLASLSLNSQGSQGNLKNNLQATSFSTIGRPGPTVWVVKNLVPERHPSTIFGAGGEGKSFIAMDLGIAVADPGTADWLSCDVQTAPVLYFDFELDWEVQARRAYDLAAGRGLDRPPDNLLYMSALGARTDTAFRTAADTVRQHGVRLVILDSIGPAMMGDAEASKDVLGFFRDRIDPLREAGAAVLMVDHQSKLIKGERYSDKSPFGSVYKGNLSRSVLQVQGDWDGSVLTATLRHTKSNFGPKLDPITARLTFDSEQIKVERADTPVEVVIQDAPTAKDKVLVALKDGPKYPDEIAEVAGLALKTVQNKVTELRKAHPPSIEYTGAQKGQSRQVSLASLPNKGKGRQGNLAPQDPDSILEGG